MAERAYFFGAMRYVDRVEAVDVPEGPDRMPVLEGDQPGVWVVDEQNDTDGKLLKGKGHPLHKEAARHYMVQSVRFVNQALMSSGHGWMDAAPEIERLRPEVYAVNEDGDVPEKRTFCEKHGLQYVVLKRRPKEGLPRRSSTDLRGF